MALYTSYTTPRASMLSDDDIKLQMLNDKFSFGVISKAVVLEDGAVVELCQSVDADLTCLHIKPFIVRLTMLVAVGL